MLAISLQQDFFLHKLPLKQRLPKKALSLTPWIQGDQAMIPMKGGRGEKYASYTN